MATHQLTRTLNGQVVLDRIDFAIAAGEIVALYGANGAGKTTLLRCLAGAMRPTSGQVLWFGTSPARQPDCHRWVGFAAHESFLYVELSVRENLLFAARMQGLAHPDEQVAAMLAHCGLDHRAEQAAGELSQGMRQRLALARALLHRPPIVVLDEPFTGLDVEGRRWLAGWLGELREQGCAICVTGHDEQQGRRIADRMLVLRRGTLESRMAVADRTWSWSA